jgi:maleylacetoacetate isomerase/maleylpyruvate isomerase
MKLYDYFRSSAAYRVRIALNLKGIAVERAHVHLVRGMQHDAAYRTRNPHGLVPALELDDGRVLTQSLAIIEYLDETHPVPALLPAGAEDRARVRGIALAIAADIHPIDNLRVLQHLEATFAADAAARAAWYAHWIALGFDALERELADDARTGRFCHGDVPTLADCCLVPQVANAHRAKLDMARWPTLARIDAACLAIAAFTDAAPARQPDAE